jgi:hypothetical protein
LGQFRKRDKVAGGGHLQVFFPIAAICVISFIITAIIANICGRITDESSRVQAKGGIVGACRAHS